MKESAILTSNTAAISAMLPLLRSPLPMMTPPVESSLSLTITKEGCSSMRPSRYGQDSETQQGASPGNFPGAGFSHFGGTT